MKVNLISKYRSCLMAIAMLWVAYRHSYFPSLCKPLDFVLYGCGYGGVDAFLFLSGFGIYYACKKETKYSDYIKRRLLKILPYSIFAMLVLFLLGRLSFLDFIIRGFGLTIWFKADWIQWYTSFIILIYSLVPFYYKAFKKNPLLVTCIGIAIVTVLCLQIGYRNFYIFFRTNIFLIGFLFGYINDIDPGFKVTWTLIFMVFGWWYQYYMLHHYGNDILHTQPFPFIIPGLMFLTAYIIDKIKIVVKPLSWLSKYSFQFYLIHEETLAYLYRYYDVLYRSGIKFDWLMNIAGIFISLILAVIIKKIVDLILSLFERGNLA